MTASSRWSSSPGVRRGADYDSRWEHLAQSGAAIHGEADFVCRFAPTSVLDAGCGTGRVAIELARRGIDTIGVDLDPVMLDRARSKAPSAEWVDGDLCTVDLGRTVDLVVLAGNVMIFLRPGSEAAVVARAAAHLVPGGVLVSGFQLGQGYGVDRYDSDCASAGLSLEARYSTWECDPWVDDGDYAVSVHRLR